MIANLDRLPDCVTEANIVEAICKPIAYTIAADPQRFVRLLRSAIRGQWDGVKTAKQQERDRATALKFCTAWGIKPAWVFRDGDTGLELVVFYWLRRSFIVAIGSNDPQDWRHNLRRTGGLGAYQANQAAVKTAINVATEHSTDLTVAGHSLGGEVAQYLAIDHTEVTNCITYQGAAVPPEYLRFRDGLRVCHHLHPSDPVYPLSQRRCNGGLIPGEVRYFGDRVSGFKQFTIAHSMMLSFFEER